MVSAKHRTLEQSLQKASQLSGSREAPSAKSFAHKNPWSVFGELGVEEATEEASDCHNPL